jgi:ADP-ribose pyrophosphatase
MAKTKAAPIKKSKLMASRTNRGIHVESSKLSYEGPLFNVFTDMVLEPGGKVSRRDVIRHNGSVVILAVDDSRSKSDPLIVMERQYRHAAKQYLWELPAGKMDAGEKSLAGAKRELIEETGYRAKRWSKLVRYFASPGFLGEWMQVYLAEGISAGVAEPEEDEFIHIELVPLSTILKMIDEGKIMDGKTLISTMLYARKKGLRPKVGAKSNAKG